MELQIRPASEAHAGAMAAIYAHYVLNATCSFETEPPDEQEMARRLRTLVAQGLPCLVALRGTELAGYAYAGRYRERPAYRHTLEDSIYVADGCRGSGIGRALLQALLERAAAGGHRQMVAVVGDSANRGSIALHERAGFRQVGVLRDVGFKFGRWLDTVLLQRAL